MAEIKKWQLMGAEEGEEGARIYMGGAFGPGSIHHPRPKAIWFGVVAGSGTNIPPLVPSGATTRDQRGFWRVAAKMCLRPTFSPGWI